MNSVRGVTAGLVALVVVALALMVPLFLLLGPQHALVGNSLEFTTLWVGMAMVVSLVAASIAGWVAHRVSGSMTAVWVLVAVILAFGLADAGFHHWVDQGGAVMRDALPWYHWLLGLYEPLWYDLSGPVLIAVFAWVAGSSRAMEQAAPAPERFRTSQDRPE